MTFGRGPVVLALLGCLFGRRFIERQFLSILRPIEIAFFFTVLAFFIVPFSWGASVVFNTEGSTSWTVPAGATNITVKAWGGGGGGGGAGNTMTGAAGGGAGFAQATLSVTSGESLTIYVGGGGDRGSNSNYTGGGGQGGGYSGVKRGSTNLVIAAGGGGGGGGDNASGIAPGVGGVGGAITGGAGGNSNSAKGGGGGSSSAGGANRRWVGDSRLISNRRKWRDLTVFCRWRFRGLRGYERRWKWRRRHRQSTRRRRRWCRASTGVGVVNKLTRARFQALAEGVADRLTQPALLQALLPGVVKMLATIAI